LRFPGGDLVAHYQPVARRSDATRRREAKMAGPLRLARPDIRRYDFATAPHQDTKAK
jgi:hypothetical protein